ncbi:Beta-barrel assembly-enhancing protease [Thalassocella blandensis]|nr:Beta-barrel assembly-enhancing protease [Thalassocella blandensis]
MQNLLRLCFIILTVSWIQACSVNPVTGERELSLMSAEQEVAMGEQYYLASQQQQGGRYVVDPDLNVYVANVGRKLAAKSDRPNLPYEFVVLNNSTPNAWALPGGKIAINRGLLVLLDDEAQLAAVMGHEIVHAAARHGAQQQSRAAILQMGMQVAQVASSNTGYGDLIAAGAGAGAQLYISKYGRDQELQSDKYGVEYMVAAGYNPYAAVELQQTFVKLSESHAQDWLQGLFASHPPSQERVEKNQQLANQYGNKGVRNQAAYQRAIQQLKRDKAAYDLHDQALKAASANDLSKALNLTKQAISKQPNEALFYVTKGQIELSENQISTAKSTFSRAIQLNPEYYTGHLGLGLIAKEQKQYGTAKQYLEKSVALLPTQVAMFHLGELELNDGNQTKAAEYFSVVAQQGGELGEKAQIYLNKLQPASAG